MKTFNALVAGMVFLISISINAQVSVNVHIGSPPSWGPVGYATERYYYLPDVESYYDVNSSMFIYNRYGVWVRRAYLPSRYRNYDLYNGYKVVMTGYRGETPYHSFSNHKVKYAKGYRGGAQKTIGVRPIVVNAPVKNIYKGNGNNKGKRHNDNHGKGHGKGHGGGGKGKGK